MIFCQNHQKIDHRPIQYQQQILPKKQTLACSNQGLTPLFIELHKMDGSVSKKAVSPIRNQLESIREQGAGSGSD